MTDSAVSYRSGWRPSKTKSLCVRWVAGKHCLSTSLHRECECGSFRHTVLDRVKAWNTEKGRLLTSEPYQLLGEELCRFVDKCSGLRLRVLVHGTSPHQPGTTVMVEIRRGDQTR